MDLTLPQAILAANPFEIYWDNTGGPQLDAVRFAAREQSRRSER